MKYYATIERSDTTFTDIEISTDVTYYYKLTAVTENGSESLPSNEVSAMIKDLSENIGEATDIADNFRLNQNYPNPFNPSTTIEYDIPEYTNVSIVVYDLLGRKIKQLVNEYKEAGTYQVIWNGRDSNNKRVSSGYYFYQMTTVNFVEVKKLLIQK
jgi:hypothetical protein